MLHGPDISEHQGPINFQQLLPNVDFVIMRAAFGVPDGGRQDYQFTPNRNALRASNKPRGYYYYAYPDNDPVASADYFASVVCPLEEGEIVALDFEEPYGDPVGWCLSFLNHFHAVAGVRPVLYINLALASSHDWTPVVNADFGLWLAQWDFNPNSNSGQTVWASPVLRQYTDKSTLPGISGLVDESVLYGDAQTFAAYGYHAAAPAPAPVTPPVVEPVIVPVVPAAVDPVAPVSAPVSPVPPLSSPSDVVPQTVTATSPNRSWLFQLVASIISFLRGLVKR